MKYICKKSYSDIFCVGDYYEVTRIDNKGHYNHIIIRGYIFIDKYSEYIKPFIYDYFTDISEIRKIKLEKLNEIQMQNSI